MPPKQQAKKPPQQVTAYFAPHTSPQRQADAILDPQTDLGEGSAAQPSGISPVDDLKNMIIDLKSTLQADIKQLANDIRKEIQGDRTAHMETKMAEYAAAHNDLADSHTQLESEMDKLKDKVADLEDRSRRNNLKLRGIPETITPPELEAYLKGLLETIMPEAPQTDLTIDRIHRIPKPKTAPEPAPRDVLTKIHFFKTKEKLLQAARKKEGWPEKYKGLQIYTEMSLVSSLMYIAIVVLVTLVRRQTGVIPVLLFGCFLLNCVSFGLWVGELKKLFGLPIGVQ
uniref:L1 transposable element RRM domain-containing protein n=1 Tax=Xenopus tropicalis TaxID=8364 RepID=A0A803JZM3_XENTR